MTIFQATTLTDENSGVDVGRVSLRDAIETAKANSGQDAGIDAKLSGSIAPAEIEIPSLCTLMATIAAKL